MIHDGEYVEWHDMVKVAIDVDTCQHTQQASRKFGQSRRQRHARVGGPVGQVRIGATQHPANRRWPMAQHIGTSIWLKFASTRTRLRGGASMGADAGAKGGGAAYL